MSMLCLASGAIRFFNSQTRYYITSDYRTGYLSLSSAHHDSFSYELCMYDGRDGKGDDRYWYISGDEATGYVLTNASTGQHMSWSDDYNTKRNLEMTDNLSNDCRWDIVATDENSSAIAFRMRNNPAYHLNIRSSGFVSNYNNRYGENSFTPNDHFHIFDEYGNEVLDCVEPPHMVTVHCLVSGTDEEFDVLEYPLSDGSYTLTEFPDYDGKYTFSHASVGLPYTFTDDADVYAYYDQHEPKTVTVYCLDSESGNQIGQYDYTFYADYTLTSWPVLPNYDFQDASCELPATFTASAHVYVYYSHRQYFKTTTIVDGNFAKDTPWYRLSIRGGKQIYTDGTDVPCNLTVKPFEPQFFWCFVEAGDGLYRLYNYATGANAPLSAESTRSNIHLQMNADYPVNTFTVVDNRDGFTLQVPGVSPSSCCNDVNNALGLWTYSASLTDYGSCIIAEEIGAVDFTKIESITLSDEHVFIKEGESYQALATYTPADAVLHNMQWKTNDTSVAVVDASGRITGTGGGDAVITVSSAYDPSITATCIAHVTGIVRVAEIKVQPELQLLVGRSHQLDYTVAPAKADDKTVKWKSSDSKVARVDSEGKVTAVGVGMAIITVQANDDSGVYATCTVTVADIQQGILVEHSDRTVYVMTGDDRLLVLPFDYLADGYTYDGSGTFDATLISGETLHYDGVTSVGEELPVELPTFESYKFNNDFNYQVFTTAEATDPTASTIVLPVAGIGKRLTASFKLPAGAYAWVDGELQQSKKTRLRFDVPRTYTIGHYAWKELQLFSLADGRYESSLVPFGHRTTVSVDWLTDHSTNTYTVPEVYITTDDGQSITSKVTYKSAKIEIRGGGVFPDYPQAGEPAEVLIKGRGNSSWSASKKPYRLKFETKVKPLGMPKQKSWILLANANSGSMTTNAVEHKIASLMESDSPCNIIPVELYLNGRYEGSYNLCQKLGFSNASVDILDETYASMVEIDTYGESDGTPILHDRTYGMSYKIHEPDLYEKDYTGELTAQQVIDDFDRMTAMVKAGNYDQCVDISSLVSYLCTCDLAMHQELMHSKSVFCYTENVTDGFSLDGADPTLWHFGPIWDCDWSFGYENNHSFFVGNTTADFYQLLTRGSNGRFWNDLRYNNPEVDRYYYYRWSKFMNEGGIDELIEFCDDYYAYAAPSLEHNAAGYNAYDSNNYAQITANCKTWLTTRAEYIYGNLKPYTFPAEMEPGDLNADGEFTTRDIAWLIRVALGLAPDLYGTADVNGDGRVDRDDVEALARQILEK